MKKLFKVALVALMALAVSFTNVSAEDAELKFGVGVKSGDASAAIVVNENYEILGGLYGSYVDASEVKVGVMLNNVASLGVEGMKEKWWTFTTGSQYGTVDLNNWVYPYLPAEGTFTVNATVEGKEVSYAFASEAEENGFGWVVAGVPSDVEDARAAWLEVASHVEVSTAANDSKVTIVEGSYVQLGGEKLTAGATKTFNTVTFDQAMEDEIRDLLTLTEVESDDVVVFVPAGTSLTVGDDVATLLCDCTITVDTAMDLDGILGQVRDGSETVDGLLATLMSVFVDVVGQVNGQTVNVNVEFDCEETVTVVDPTCTEDGTKTTITSCGKETVEILPATGHNFVDGECTVCGEAEAPETGDTGIVALYSMMMVLAASAALVLKKKEA